MNGSTKYLLDSNILIGLLNGKQEVLELLEQHQAEPRNCAYSSITRMEVLGWSGITTEQERLAERLLASMRHIAVDLAEENSTISLRRAHKIKLPDAIIAATAQVHGLQLLTLDQALSAITSQRFV